ncbi:MBL fold metallo-hydrolase [Thiomicrorhabdus sp. 6S2-11]|uniref:MBL fold metallo-hydrolase n=1 Tax=Thiomicrorhabdus marina TaxID=2818442 RepID=A0ABS3Q7C0_9GAMM|nr:MBL fold metallo-hydrolase [Thiomicrorhabdus marina]MBO1928227.1 MBL fold metallo-hydrolase [Thiomicrorhabdus marina]
MPRLSYFINSKQPAVNLKTATLLFASLVISPAVQSSQDPYSEGMKAYQSEVENLEKRLGYIGPRLPIPKLQEIAPDTFMAVGSQIWGTRNNFGFNNNMTAVIFDNGVFIYNAGPNEPVAYAFHMQLKEITDKPVKWVAIENNQGHANMGASYWHDIGVKNIYSQKQATEEFNKKFEQHKARYMAASGNVINQHSHNVTSAYTTFEDAMSIDVGNGETVELINYGGGHTPTMSGAIVPSRKLIFTGDLGFNQRVPGLFKGGSYQDWIASFNKMEQTAATHFPLEQAVVIPGHGTADSMQTIRQQTVGYFEEVSGKIKQIIAQGGGLEQALKVDQSAHKDRPVFGQLAEPNAEFIYKELVAQK